MKIVKAVAPYIHPEFLNFKMATFNAWKTCGGQTAPEHYPWRVFHRPVFRHELPFISLSMNEARLRFVEPVSLFFDTFPDYARYEIIPMIWDCWPCYYNRMEKWLRRHKVRTAIFTSSYEMKEMLQKIPNLNALFCPEAVDTSLYDGGTNLKDRAIDLLEFGRSNKGILPSTFQPNIKHVCTKVHGKFVFNNEELYAIMGDAKIVIALPRSMTDPNGSGGVETLTQRYWENMLSRNVILGHAPKELIDLIGYNPVVEIKGFGDTIINQIMHILEHIEDYQELVNKNRNTALELGDWQSRIPMIQSFLSLSGYKI